MLINRIPLQKYKKDDLVGTESVGIVLAILTHTAISRAQTLMPVEGRPWTIQVNITPGEHMRTGSALLTTLLVRNGDVLASVMESKFKIISPSGSKYTLKQSSASNEVCSSRDCHKITFAIFPTSLAEYHALIFGLCLIRVNR